jgi:hypothetical protein
VTGQWTRHAGEDGELSTRRAVYWYYVTPLVEGERLYEVAPVSAEAQIEFAEALLGNAALYAAVLAWARSARCPRRRFPVVPANQKGIALPRLT